ncbi:hypothetical protein [Saezia sanguinis]|uniref:hypothetical protein n=1 Tax=Saezia sanguinis TaxID=1965230 RepID=UPI003061DE98
MPDPKEIEIIDTNLGACVNIGGIPVIIPPSATTEGENSDKPDTLVVKCITRKRPYFVMMPYYRADAESKTRAFVAAANFKKERLQKLYPDARIDVKPVTKADDFKTVWNGINGLLTGPMIGYDLREVHYFGHSDFDNLYLFGDEISYDDVPELQQLPWSAGVGKSAFVLHSCRSSRFEEQNEGNKALKKCIANAFSESHRVRVIGQVVYATNNTGDSVAEWKYRNSSSENKRLIDELKVNNVVLWGYCAGGSSSGYMTSSEYWNLKSGQIWPCRGFFGGSDLPRTVAKDVFNSFDLTYI